MKKIKTIQTALCACVVPLAILGALQEPDLPLLSIAALCVLTAGTAAAGASKWRQEALAVCFLTCLVYATRYRVPTSIPILDDDVLHVRPAVLLMAVGGVAAVFRRRESGAEAGVPLWRKTFIGSALVSALILTTAYSLLSTRYALEFDVFRQALMGLVVLTVGYVVFRGALRKEAPQAEGRLPNRRTDAGSSVPPPSRRGTWALLFLAVAASPIAWKFPLGPIGVALPDLALGLAAVTLVPTGMRELRTGMLWNRIEASLPLFLVAVLSALSASDPGAAAQELAQVGFYLLVGPWIFALVAMEANWRRCLLWAARGALLAALGGCVLLAIGGETRFAHVFGNPNVLGCSLALAACICLTASGARKRVGQAFVGLAVVVGLGLLAWAPAEATDAPDTEGRLESAVPQRYLEAYAALSVLSDRPLFGTGLGTYQLHIGEYYQGMPKDNTIAPGSRIGYGVLLASMGLLGLSGYLYWLGRLWQHARSSHYSARHLHLTLLALLLCGYFTAPFVSQLLVPMGAIHGLAVGGWKADA